MIVREAHGLSEPSGPTGRPLSWSRTVAREAVHRVSVAEVLLTDVRTHGDNRFEAAAQWPRSHPTFPHGKDGRHHPLMIAETLRELGIYIPTRYYAVPAGAHFLIRDISYRLDPETEPRAPYGASDITCRVAVTDIRTTPADASSPGCGWMSCCPRAASSSPGPGVPRASWTARPTRRPGPPSTATPHAAGCAPRCGPHLRNWPFPRPGTCWWYRTGSGLPRPRRPPPSVLLRPLERPCAGPGAAGGRPSGGRAGHRRNADPARRLPYEGDPLHRVVSMRPWSSAPPTAERASSGCARPISARRSAYSSTSERRTHCATNSWATNGLNDEQTADTE